jgi:hypothetical protein
VHNLLKEPPQAVAPIVREMNARLAHKASMLADHILARISDYDINKASLKEKALAAAILMDKAQMLAERPEPPRITADGRFSTLNRLLFKVQASLKIEQRRKSAKQKENPLKIKGEFERLKKRARLSSSTSGR